jgi:hypothetical protein
MIAAAVVCGVIAGGCDRLRPVTMTLHGDSVAPVALLDYPKGVKGAECGFTVEAEVTGPEGESATLSGGSIVYSMVQTGDTMFVVPVTGDALAHFWEVPTTSIAAGTTLKSKRQGISLSVPVNPVRGSLTFTYTGAGADSARTTDPYVFVCR